MFARRTVVSERPNPLHQLIAERRKRGASHVDLTVSNPTAVGLGIAWSDLRTALDQPAAATYVPAAFGLAEARRAAAAWMGPDVEPDRVVLSASTSEAYTWIFKILCNPGEAVAVPRPCYPLVEWLARLEAVEVVPYDLYFAAGRWNIDLDSLARAAPGVRAVVVIAPGNPTGALLRRSELGLVETLCADRGLALLVDEVFAESAGVFGPLESEVVTAAHGPRACLTFVLRGLSKTCLLPQCKLAWTTVCGPDQQVEQALMRLELVADTFLSVASPVQHALQPLLASAPGLQEQLAARLRDNRAALVAACAGSAVDVLAAEGGWSAILRHPLAPDREVAESLLTERGILVHPGWFYDLEGPYVVTSLLPRPEVFAHSARDLVAGLVEGGA